MSIDQDVRPWDVMLEIIERNDGDQLKAYLDSLPGHEIARALARLDEDDRSRMLVTLEPKDAADLVEQLPEEQAVDIIEELEPQEAAAIVNEMESDEQADLLAELDDDEADAILEEMEPEEAEDARRLMRYESDVAGGLMLSELVAYAPASSVKDVRKNLRDNLDEFGDWDIRHIYAVGAAEKLIGRVGWRELFLSPNHVTLSELIDDDTPIARDQTPLQDLEHEFERRSTPELAVVDDRDRLVGVLHRSQVEEALSDRAEDEYRAAQGIVGGEEFRTMPTHERLFRRLVWLTVTLVLNGISVTVIAINQGIIDKVIALTVFLPLIGNLSGSSGNQAVAVSMRELALGLVKPEEVWLVCRKEATVGLVNGLILGTLIGTGAWLWQQNAYLSFVVGLAFVLNGVVAVTLGGSIPLLLRRMGKDPAVGSGPILATLTDACGFFLVLSLATAFAEKLV